MTTKNGTGSGAPAKAPEPARGESAGAGVKKALRFARCALSTATAWKGRYVYAIVPSGQLVEAGLVKNPAEARKHPFGMFMWVDFDGEYWHLGIDTYGPGGTYLFRGPYEFGNAYEATCNMLDFAEFFLEEPRPLTEVELELPVEEEVRGHEREQGLLPR